MPLDQPVVFPLLPMTPEGKCTCRLGPACTREGKHPAVLWRDLEEGSQVPMPAPGAGFGIKTGARPKGSGIVVVDLDGEGAIDAWVDLGGSEDTYTVQTGRGLQLYFQHPGFYAANSKKKLWKNGEEGIDIRGDGGFVVGAGSPHVSGATYTVVNDRGPAPLPGWLLEWFRQQPGRAEVQPHPEDVEGPERERRREIYGTWLASEAPICVSGQGGDETLFKVVQKGTYDLALPTEDVVELLAEHYDPRCSPPWGEELEERVLHKANDAKTKSTRPRNPPLTAEEEAAWTEVMIERTRLTEPEPETLDAENDYGFKLKRGGWDVRPVPPKYLVDHLLVEGKVSMIFAEPGTIKSWTAIDLAACVSEGVPWLGERATVRGPALCVDFEDGEHEFHRRVHILAGGEEREDLFYSYAPGIISEKEWWTRLEAVVRAYKIRFVVIDTLAGGSPGVDENATTASAPLLFAGWFTERTGATVLVLHHANRAGDIRGTSAFKANVDTLFKLETVEDKNGVHRAKLTCVKSGHKKVYPVYLELTDDGLRKYEHAETEKEKDPGAGEEGDRRTLDELQAELLLVVESEGPFASFEKLRERLRTSKRRVTALVAELQQSGDVFKSPEGWRRDNESLRQGRLRAAIERLPGGGRGKLMGEACVTKEFFEQCRREGRVRQGVVGDEASGFVWVDL